MEELIRYLYCAHVNSNDPHLDHLAKGDPLKVYALSDPHLDAYAPLIIRNILAYSPATLELKLSLPALLAFSRLGKVEALMKEHNLEYFFKEWLDNQFMPFRVPASRKIPPQTNFVYVDEAGEEKVEAAKPKAKSGDKKPATQMFMLNLSELTRELETQLIMKQFGLEREHLNKEEDRAAAKAKAQWRKFEEYICERYSQDTLLVLNAVCLYPFMEEKQILARTMLPVVEVRKCLNNLMADGLINFYAENSRSMLFKATKRQQLIEGYRKHIAQSILNLSMFLEKQKDEAKKKLISASLWRLDDILLLLL